MAAPSHILVVDDEDALLRVLDPVLTTSGYRVSTRTTGVGAIRAVEAERPDLVLLDLGLPDIDGKAVIAAVRRFSAAPVIVVSARHQEREKIEALDAGADDYVDKPFEIGVLMARIRAAIRRTGQELVLDFYRSGPLTINLAACEVRLGADPVRLSPKEFALLSVLVPNAGKVVTHKRLLAAGWGPEAADTAHLRVYIALIRQKIEQHPSDPRILMTVPGIGYRLATSGLP